MTPIARVERLSYAYERGRRRSERSRLAVLDDVSLDVAPGEVVSLIGPSGCGKTTLLRILAGLASMRGATGTAEVAGRPVVGPSPEIAFAFQNVGLVPWRTVRGNAEFGRELGGHGRLDARERAAVQAVIELVGLRGFEDYYPHQLSGGMQQRVGMARALATDPALLLMDEPFGALDAQSRRLFQDEVLRWRAARPFSAILVTHDLDEALYLSDRVIVMSARPARILKEVVVDLPGRHGGVSLRSIDGYAALHDTLWDLLLEQNRRSHEEHGEPGP